nr:hypothetical protein [uncultured Sphingomonas sp.]
MSKFPVFGATAWLTACLFPAPVTAQSRQDTDPLDRDIVAVGAGLAAVPDYEGSDHYRPVVAPVAIGSVKGHSFVVAGNQASLDLLRDRPGPVWQVQVGPFAQINFNLTTFIHVGKANPTIDIPRPSAVHISPSDRCSIPALNAQLHFDPAPIW